MEIIIRDRRYRLPSISNQNLLAMKLTVIICTICLVQLSARTFSQTVSYSAKNANLVQIFHSIEKQTGYTFFYNDAELAKAKTVTLELKSAPLQSALEKVLQDQPFQYTIKGNTIFIKAKPIQPLPLGSGVSSLPNETAAPPPANIEVTITVLNNEGQPLEGASIIVKGNNKGVATDINGRAILKDVDPGALLLIGFTGYVTQEIKLNGRNSVVVKLVASTNELEEVIINKGYYTEKQRFSVSNAVIVKGEDIAKQPINNPLLAMQGRVPGLEITQQSGLSGGGVRLRIQGVNTLGTGTNPLIVVDGIPFLAEIPSTGVSSPLGGSGGFGGSGSPLAYIDPQNIESITVLKDADATAIYGSRAANGAILITTKRPKMGKVQGEFSIQYGWGKVAHSLDMLNTREYLDMRYEAYRNENTDWTSPSVSADDLKVWDTTRYTDWQKSLLGGTANYTTLNASLAGGNEQTQFIAGITHNYQTTVFPYDFADKKSNIYINLKTNSLNRKFRMQLTASYLLGNNYLSGGDMTTNALLLEPNAPALFNPDGSINWATKSDGTSSWLNPAASFLRRYHNETSNLIANGTFGVTLLSGLELSANLGYSKLTTNDFYAIPQDGINPEIRTIVPRSSTFGNRSISSWTIEPKLTYDKKFDKSTIEILLGTTFYQNLMVGGSITGSGYSSDAVLRDILSAPTVVPGTSIYNLYKYSAAFGRINYRWLDKYIVNFSARYDGSTRFGSENRFHGFGSIGVGWIFSNERAFKEKLGILSFGKLKFNYGTTGNDQIGDYQFLSLYSPTSSNVTTPYQGLVGIRSANLPNPYLQWEENKKLSVGIDIGLMNDRLVLNVVYSSNRSSNLLTPYALPSTTGFTNIVQNFPATIQNSSWEFILNSIHIKRKDLLFSTSFNLTIPRNKLVEFPNLEKSSYSTSLIIGQPISFSRLYQYAGVDPQTGRYMDINSQGNPTFSPVSPIDRPKILSAYPQYYGGMQNTIAYKGFQLDFMLQFVKQEMLGIFFANSNGTPPGVLNKGLSNQPRSVLNRWRKPGDMADIRKYTTQLLLLITELPFATNSTGNVVDGSYLRLKNISISYDIPSNWVRKLHLQSARIFFSGQNIFTLTQYQGLDPETLNSNLPPLRVITVGAKITL